MDELEKFKNMTPEEANAYLEEFEACTHDCSTCSADCSSRVKGIAGLTLAVISGKGGTGKSTVTVLLAAALKKRGLSVAILDADVVNAEIPHLLDMHEPVLGEAETLTPASGKYGIPVISMALVAEDPKEPVIYPGLDLAKVAVYFMQEAKWGNPDVLLVDMPSGAGDIPLEYFTTQPFDRSLVVLQPGEYAGLAQRRALNLAEMLMVPPIGVFVNFADGDFAVSKHFENMRMLGSLPYDPALRRACDECRVPEYDLSAMDGACDLIAELCKKQ